MLDHNTMLRPTCARVLISKQWQISKSEIQKNGLENPCFIENEQDNFFKFTSNQELIYWKNSIPNKCKFTYKYFQKN